MPQKKNNFKWEQEWRIKTKELPIDPMNCSIFIKDSIYKDKLVEHLERERELADEFCPNIYGFPKEPFDDIGSWEFHLLHP